jgi:hypothetical protein
MDKTKLLITCLLTLLMIVLGVSFQPVIDLLRNIEDTLMFVGLFTVCFGVATVVNIIKSKLGKK